MNWVDKFNSIKTRCNKRSSFYFRNGIKVKISCDELKELWLRDKADFMVKPTIHRINPIGNYTKDNCQFIEWAEHKHHSKRRIAPYRWARHYNQCVRCGDSKSKHEGYGLCKKCYYETIERKTRKLVGKWGYIRRGQ